uniref:histidine kinase n=1 Tax=Cyanothece sp. (strain PCC 7425 / ATCC 29141) TaxID=395961 RepID=B8HKH1_CYAP4
MVRNGRPTLSNSITYPVERILLIEDNRAEARLLQEILKGSSLHRAELTHVSRLEEGFVYCEQYPVDIILLDLTLPDSYGLASLDKLLAKAPGVPIVVLTNTNDNELAVEAVRRGAQDYLVKRQVNQDLLVRSLRYAIERQQGEEALRVANETLEQRVQKRTAQLDNTNTLLLQEIQERKHIQERLSLAQEAAKMGTFEWNLLTHRVIWSPELENLYEVEPGSFGDSYEGWLKLVHEDDRPAIEQALHRAMQEYQPIDLEFKVLRGPGAPRWMTVKSNIYHDSRGIPQRMVGIHMDITEKKQLEAQFMRAQRLESLGTLASGIAHDLNNILTPILGVAQLLPLKFPHMNEQTRQLLDTLETSARRGSALIKQILSFARGIEGKHLSLQLSHLLQEIRQIIIQTLPKSIDIHLNLQPQLWMVEGDVTQLHQVFMNLCVNARDAMPQGGSLEIQAENLELDEAAAHTFLEARPGRYVRVTITDTGKGIPPENLSRIFDPFFTTKEIGKGTGLGLSAVLGIVKSHRGFIDVQSEVNRGSQFSVYLPAAQTDTSPEEETIDLLLGHHETILIVDDEAAIREVVKTTLETYQYRVLTAASGTEAITLYQTHKDKIDLLLIDMMMPGMDGALLIRLLLQINPEVKAIAMSGLSSEQRSDQFTSLGFRHFLAKPLSAEDLLKALRHCLET